MAARKQPTGRPHPFVAEPDMPADHRGRIPCQACHVPGRVGDARHPDPSAPPPELPAEVAAAARAHDAAVLGEPDREDHRPWTAR